MEVLKKGDINKGGWEVVEVRMKPEYKLKKRIKVNDDFHELHGKEGWMYLHLGFKWFELDDIPNKQLKLKEQDYQIIEWKLK